MKIKFENYGSYRLGIKVGQWQAIWHLRRPIWAIQKAYRGLREYLSDLTGQSIYGIWWSRDCDMCESSSPARFNNRKALERAYEKEAEWADGPFSFTECSRDEFLSATTQTRDRVLEAYENGNGRSIYV